MQLRQLISLIALVGLLAAQGCISHQTEMGQRLDPAKINQITEGKTTEAEVVALLGQPQRVQGRPDGSKIMIYSHHLTQIYGHPNLNDAKGGVSHEMLFLGIRDGIVKKKWESASNQPLKMNTGKTLSVPDQFK